MTFHRNQVHLYLDTILKYDWVISTSFFISIFFQKFEKKTVTGLEIKSKCHFSIESATKTFESKQGSLKLDTIAVIYMSDIQALMFGDVSCYQPCSKL